MSTTRSSVCLSISPSGNSPISGGSVRSSRSSISSGANPVSASRLSEHTEAFHDDHPLVAQSTFSVEYLDGFFSGLKKTQYADATYRFRLGTEVPLGIERMDEAFPGRIAFMLAPRIQSD